MKIDFTAIIPVFNTKPAHLIEAASSLLHQIGYLNFPIILVDDGSTDPGTLQALEGLNTKPRVKTFRIEKNRGTSVALNVGTQIAATPWVLIMGSDDISHASRVIRQVKYLEKHPETDVLGTNLYAFYDDDPERKAAFFTHHKEKPQPRISGRDHRYWLVNHGTTIYKKEKAEAVGGYTKPGRGQDVDLWQRMHQNGCIFRNLTESLYGWRRFR
jgi:glycosyltransferase involved in cell wall biosynthesis